MARAAPRRAVFKQRGISSLSNSGVCPHPSVRSECPRCQVRQGTLPVRGGRLMSPILINASALSALFTLRLQICENDRDFATWEQHSCKQNEQRPPSCDPQLTLKFQYPPLTISCNANGMGRPARATKETRTHALAAMTSRNVQCNAQKRFVTLYPLPPREVLHFWALMRFNFSGSDRILFGR